MKYKIIGTISTILTLIIAFTTPFLINTKSTRYHQHLEKENNSECMHSDQDFCTHLPLVQINTGGEIIPGLPVNDTPYLYTKTENGDKELLCNISITDNTNANNHLTDAPQINSNAFIRVRGKSSRRFDKSSYSIRFVNSKSENNPLSVMGMDAHHEWVLHGPFLDKSLLRNYIWYNIAGEIMDYAPNVRFCEVIINNQYNGLYLMTETITAGKNGSRLNLSVDKKDNKFSGYLLRLDIGSEAEIKNINTFSTYSYKHKSGKFNIEYPGITNLTEPIAEKISLDFSDFERALYSFDYDKSQYGYSKYIDIDSFVNYFIINEFTCNYDAGSFSTYIYKDIDNKYRMCVWDFNNSCDNYQEQATDMDDFLLQDSIWYFMLCKDEDFTNRIIRKYRQLRKSYLSTDFLNDYIDSTIEYLGDAIDRNYKKWGYTFSDDCIWLQPKERHIASYDDSINQLKSFLKKRGDFLDENIEAIKQYSVNSKTKTYNEYVN